MSDESPAWTRRITHTPGHLERLREMNPEDVYKFHVSEEMVESLDAVVSQEKAQAVVREMNEIGYPECKSHMREQLADITADREYSNLALLFYVTDRCNRE